MKKISKEEEESLLLNSLLSRLTITENDLITLRTLMNEDIIKTLNDTVKKDSDLDKYSTGEIDTLKTMLTNRLHKMTEEYKTKHNEHLEQKTILLCELQALKDSNAKLYEDSLKMLQHLELLEMRIGKSKNVI